MKAGGENYAHLHTGKCSRQPPFPVDSASSLNRVALYRISVGPVMAISLSNQISAPPVDLPSQHFIVVLYVYSNKEIVQ